MRILTLLLVSSLFTACGGTTQKDDDAAPQSASPTATASPALTMSEVCPQVETLLGGVSDLADGSQEFADSAYRFVNTDIAELKIRADEESRNALALFDQFEDKLLKGGTALELDGAFLDAVDAFANRCKAAGSSALQ